MERNDGWITAHYFDGAGGAEKTDGTLRADGGAEGRCVWIQLDMNQPDAQRWVREDSGLSEVAVEALLADETRPRCHVIDDGVLVNLRGVNLNPGADPADMVSIRMWAENDKIVSVQRRRLRAVNDVERRLLAGNGPKDSGEFLADLSDCLNERMSHVIVDLDDRVDELEQALLDSEGADFRANLRSLRREVIELRRYIGPQREAMTGLSGETIDWIPGLERQHLRESADRLTRYIEDIDVARERTAVVQDELSSNMSARMNKNMYMLAIIAGVFLPLTLITGLLGINVAGIPGEDWSGAFFAVAGMLVAVGVLELILLRRLHWL